MMRRQYASAEIFLRVNGYSLYFPYQYLGCDCPGVKNAMQLTVPQDRRPRVQFLRD
jgi:hypothetical protein